jgi:hypothetical protein
LLNLQKKLLAQMCTLPFAQFMDTDMPSKQEGSVEGQRAHLCQVASGRDVLLCIDDGQYDSLVTFATHHSPTGSI